MTTPLETLARDVKEQGHLWPQVFRGMDGLQHVTLALCEEAGECAGVVVKARRDNPQADTLTADAQQRLIEEMGDTLWWIQMLCERMGITLDKLAELNQQKLVKRRNGAQV